MEDEDENGFSRRGISPGSGAFVGVRERKGAIVKRPKEGTAPKSEGYAGNESSLLARSKCQLARKV